MLSYLSKPTLILEDTMLASCSYNYFTIFQKNFQKRVWSFSSRIVKYLYKHFDNFITMADSNEYEQIHESYTHIEVIYYT